MFSLVVKDKFSVSVSNSAEVKKSKFPIATTVTLSVEISISGVVVAKAVETVKVSAAIIVIRFFIITVCTYKTVIRGCTLSSTYYRRYELGYRGTTGVVEGAGSDGEVTFSCG